MVVPRYGRPQTHPPEAMMASQIAPYGVSTIGDDELRVVVAPPDVSATVPPCTINASHFPHPLNGTGNTPLKKMYPQSISLIFPPRQRSITTLKALQNEKEVVSAQSTSSLSKVNILHASSRQILETCKLAQNTFARGRQMKTNDSKDTSNLHKRREETGDNT